VIRDALRAIPMLFLLSLAACSGEPPDQPYREQSSSETHESPAAITTPDGNATQASESAERTVLESTVGGAVLRRDEGVLTIEHAELLRSKEGDEIFVRATVKGPAEARDCYLIKGSTWFVLRDAIESEDVSYAPRVLEATWADPAATTRFSGGDTLALSFQEDVNRIDEDPDPRDTPFFAVCYKFASIGGDGPGGATWYDVAHVEGSPKAP
jgi:hypothetical protein